MENGNNKTDYQTYLDAAFNSGLTGRQLRVYCVIIKYCLRMKQYRFGAALGAKDFAEQLNGMERKNVSRAIKDLIRFKMITQEKYKPGVKNTYRWVKKGVDVSRNQKTLYYHRDISKWDIK